jgi:putative sterol carrier protein
VAAFLSPAWLAALGDAARRHGPVPTLADQPPLVLGAEVHLDNGETVSYQVRFGGDGIAVEPTPDGPADLTIVADYATAVALARGETNGQQALTAGALRLRGDIDRIARAREAFVALADCFTAVRAGTDFG